MTASREVLALVARAARLVGEQGKVIVQTRRPSHPLLLALSQQDVASALLDWSDQDIAQRKMFGLPPFGVLAHVSVKSPSSVSDLPSIEGVDIARFEDFAIVKAATRDDLAVAITEIRQTLGALVRVHADPVRY
jgi:primosomal protein N'